MRKSKKANDKYANSALGQKQTADRAQQLREANRKAIRKEKGLEAALEKVLIINL